LTLDGQVLRKLAITTVFLQRSIGLFATGAAEQDEVVNQIGLSVLSR